MGDSNRYVRMIVNKRSRAWYGDEKFFLIFPLYGDNGLWVLHVVYILVNKIPVTPLK